MTATAPSIWVVSDGRRGIENQALGLAEALDRLAPMQIKRKIIGSDPSFAALPPSLQYLRRAKPVKYGLAAPFPNVAIGCGRQAIAPLRSIKKANPDTFTAYVQDPRGHYKHFDLIIAPAHDKLTRPNAVSIIGAPNRVTDKTLNDAQTEFSAELARFKAPFSLLLIGGPSQKFTLSQTDIELHLSAAKQVLQARRSLLISLSRRTPKPVRDIWASFAKSNAAAVWLYDTARLDGAPNPYFAFLAAAETIYVTQESTNMLTDSCTAGKAVIALPMTGAAGKFDTLYKALEDRCGMTWFDRAAPPATSRAFMPLRETDRAAKILWDKYQIG